MNMCFRIFSLQTLGGLTRIFVFLVLLIYRRHGYYVLKKTCPIVLLCKQCNNNNLWFQENSFCCDFTHVLYGVLSHRLPKCQAIY
jgi:hypothetical protein